MRLFVAVVPPPFVRAHLDLALASVRRVGMPDDGRPVLRWAPPGDRHITLAFYGEVSEGAGEELESGLDAIAAAHRPFEVRLRGAGVFDRRILWVGCGGHVGELGQVSGDCVELGQDVTGRADRRVRSRAHLTVARAVGQGRARARTVSRAADRERSHRGPRGFDERDEIAALAHALAIYEGPAWTVDAITLLTSRPGEGKGGGPAYTPVHEAPLAGSVRPVENPVVAG